MKLPILTTLTAALLSTTALADEIWVTNEKDDTISVIEKLGGTVKGAVRFPLGTNDFSSFLLQAQGSGADVIALVAGGSDVRTMIKQADEFGIAAAGQRIAPLFFTVNDIQALGLEAAILAPRPRYAMSGLTAMLDPGQGWDHGIHPTAVIHADARLEKGVSVGPFSVVSKDAHIGAGTVIGPQCYIGTGARIGQMSLVREGVKIGARVTTGDRFIAQPGAAIGGVPPFGHPAPLPTVIDDDLFAHDVVWAAAGTPRDVFPITPGDLARACDAVRADLRQA